MYWIIEGHIRRDKPDGCGKEAYTSSHPKLNHGDLKATQGDTGHAEIDMITKVYAHILDEDRKVNAQKFENAFYAVNRDLRNVQPPQEQPQAATLDLAALIDQLQKSPELAQTLAALIAGQKAVWNLKLARTLFLLARTSFLFVSN